MPKCPRCGERMTRNEGETWEEFTTRYENSNCPESEYS